MAETKVRRAGALNCFANGERRALDNVREAILYKMEWRVCVKVKDVLFLSGEM